MSKNVTEEPSIATDECDEHVREDYIKGFKEQRSSKYFESVITR